jgi:hypothetical protein
MVLPLSSRSRNLGEIMNAFFRTTRKLMIAIGLALVFSGEAQIKKVLITDFYYQSLHVTGRSVSQALVKEIGLELGFTVDVVASEGKITADYLKGYDLVVWNSLSSNGSQSPATKAVWEAWVEGGGALLSLHAGGDTRTGTWTWYMEGILDAIYEGHSAVEPADVWLHPDAIASNGQFHPILKNQDKFFKAYTITGESQKRWAQPWSDEWYKFTKNPDPATKDLTVLLELDEFNKRGVTTWDPLIAKTGYHPMSWARENIGVGKGRLVYICTGHDDKIMASKDKGVKELWKNAMLWATKNSTGCKTIGALNYNQWADKADGSCSVVSIQVPSKAQAFSLNWKERLQSLLRDVMGRVR